MHPDSLDIPEFLRITEEARAEARKRCRPHIAQPSYVRDSGPGSVCRAHGIPDGINHNLEAEVEAENARIEERKKAEGLASLADWKARHAEEKAEREEVKKRAKAARRLYNTSKRRSK